MSRRPEEILASKVKDAKPFIEQFDKELDRRFEGKALYIDEPGGINEAVYKALSEHYRKFGWLLSRSAATGKNESYIVFTPQPPDFTDGDGQIGAK